MSELTPNTDPRVVVFDAVGTLIFPDPPAPVVYAQFGKRFGSQLAVETIRQKFGHAITRQDQQDRLDGLQRRNTNEQRERERWRIIVAEIFEDVIDADGELFEALWGHFGQGHHWRMFDDVAPTWRRLQCRGMVLAIASNFDERLLDICQAHEPLSGCQHIHWSAEIGYPKPSPEFFAEMSKRIAAVPEEMLFVGDSPVNDYQGAQAAGWNAKLLCRQDRHAAGPDEITSLREVLSQIGDE